MQVTLELSVEQVQYILNTLSEKPFREVADIIPLIMKQTTEQTQARAIALSEPQTQ